MPNAQVTSSYWFIRITAPHMDIAEQLYRGARADGWPSLSTDISWQFCDHIRFLVVAHVGEKTEKEHVHCLVELSEPKQKQTVDKRCKRIFGVSGPNYSSKVWDGDMGSGAGSYLFHDAKARVLLKHGFTDEQIEEFQRLNAEVQKVVEVNKQRASGRCVERILSLIVDSGRMWTKDEIAMKLLTDIKEGVMYEPGDYVLKRYLEEIYLKQLAKPQWEQYARLRIRELVRPESIEVSFPM